MRGQKYDNTNHSNYVRTCHIAVMVSMLAWMFLMEIARFILEDCGALVEPVSNGLEAVHKFEASAEEAFDVILMDIMMPVMDGITATKTIRAMERPDA